MKYLILSIFSFLQFSSNASAQIVDIPDPNFLEGLIRLGVDTNLDGMIQESEAIEMYDLNLENNNISDLTGIEAFTMLTHLDCGVNNLTSVNLSQNINLLWLTIYGNKLTELDVTNLESLTDLLMYQNQVKSLDLSKNILLVEVSASDNDISNIVLPPDSGIITLDLINNPLTSIDVSGQWGLTSLYLDDTDIISLDLSELFAIADIILDKKVKFLSIDGFSFPSVLIEEGSGESDLELICTNDLMAAEEILFLNSIPNSQVEILLDCKVPDLTGELSNSLEGNIFISSDLDCNDTLSTQSDIVLNCYNDNGDLIYQLSSLSSSSFFMRLPSGRFTVEPEFLNKELFDVSPESFVVDLQGNETINQDFCIVPKSQSTKFIKVDMLSTDVPRPGFESQYKVKYSNIGNIVTDGEIIVTYQPTKMEHLGSNPLMEELSAFELAYKFTHLEPFEEREIIIDFELNSPMDTPPLNGGDILEFCAYAILPDAPGLSDFDFTKLRQTVVNSFDPNDKTCLQGDVVMDSTLGRYLDYIIRFENTGTAEAVNITVEDKIDTDVFDINTLRIVDASHEVQAYTEGDVVSFYFEDIFLPFDDENNDGYVVFELRTNEQLALGDTIANNADIFFDFNFPIRTNTTESLVATDMDMDGYHNLEDCDDDNASIYPGAPEIVGNGIDEDCDGDDLSGTHELNGTSVEIYPNPTSDILHIIWERPTEFSYQFIDYLGKYIMGGNNRNAIDLSSLENGIYILKVKDSKGENFFIENIIVSK